MSTLAYHGSREPPKNLRLGKNVMIRVCLDTVDQSAPLSHPRNAEWARRLRAWRAAAPRVWVWDYLTMGAYNVAPLPAGPADSGIPIWRLPRNSVSESQHKTKAESERGMRFALQNGTLCLVL